MIRNFEDHEITARQGVYIDPDATVIGNVTLGEFASIWPGAVVRGDVHAIRIGARSNVQDGCVLHVSHDSRFKPGGRALEIGDDVTIGHKAVLHACTVEHACFIGIGCILLDDAVIESGAMLGAGALVTPGQRVQGGYLYLGAPARQVRPLSAEERELIQYSAEHYVRLAQRHLVSLTREEMARNTANSTG